MSHAVHPIEAESYRILRARVDLSHLPALMRAVTERVVHASADLEYADTLLTDEAALQSGREATVPLLDPRTAELATRAGITHTAAAMRLAAAETGPGAVWVVGNAPTALFELLERPPRDPALIVGLPVGFVGAAEAKAALSASGLPCVTNIGERGGSAVAVAAVNALLYFEK